MDSTCLKMTPAQVSHPKNTKRKSMRKNKKKGSMVSVSSSSSENNISQSSKQRNVDLGQSQGFPTAPPLLAHDPGAVSIAKLKLTIPSTSDLSKTQYDNVTLTCQGSSPQEKDENLLLPNQSEDSGFAKPDCLTPDSEDSLDKVAIVSSDSTPTPPGSGSPQLDQLLSDLKEMRLEFRPETLDASLSESLDDSLEVGEISEFEELSPEGSPENSQIAGVGMSSVPLLAESNTNVAVTPDMAKTSKSSLDIDEDSPVSLTEALSIPKLPQSLGEEVEPSGKRASNVVEIFPSDAETPEQNLTHFHGEEFTSDVHLSHEGQGATTQCNESEGVTEETSTQSIRDQILCDGTSIQTTSSQSDLTPDSVTSERQFGFEELKPYQSSGKLEISSDETRQKTCEQHSEEIQTPTSYECFASRSASVQSKTEVASSASDEEYSIALGDADTSSVENTYTHIPPEYAEVVHSGADRSTFEYSDPEPYFDCKQGASDFSETEPDALETRTSGSQAQDQLKHLGAQEKANQKVLLSSGSEDYEDAPFISEPLHHVYKGSEELLHNSETSDEEFSMCEASQPPGTFYTNKSLRREITAELGSMSESSDDEFLTTRIVRRRVVIQADEMPDFPNQSVTEERYKDENGHIVVKRVTRKVIRKCVSADGVEHEEVSLEGAPQRSVTLSEGDGYSKVVKQTILKSEGDHTEVTFVESEGFPSSKQETADVCMVSYTENTTVLEGERKMTSQGDPSLASDLPSARDDFKQALGFLGGFSRAELPPVVEREIVREDGTVVRRAHMRKGKTFRRTAVKGAGRHKQVLVRETDTYRKGRKPCDLQQQLHQLFHRCYEKEKDNEDKKEEWKNE